MRWGALARATNNIKVLTTDITERQERLVSALEGALVALDDAKVQYKATADASVSSINRVSIGLETSVRDACERVLEQVKATALDGRNDIKTLSKDIHEVVIDSISKKIDAAMGKLADSAAWTQKLHEEMLAYFLKETNKLASTSEELAERKVEIEEYLDEFKEKLLQENRDREVALDARDADLNTREKGPKGIVAREARLRDLEGDFHNLSLVKRIFKVTRTP